MKHLLEGSLADGFCVVCYESGEVLNVCDLLYPSQFGLELQAGDKIIEGGLTGRGTSMNA